MNEQTYLSLSKPFVDSFANICEMMINTKAEFSEPTLGKHGLMSGAISAIMTIQAQKNNADAKGILVLSWPEDVYIKMSSEMLYEEFTEFCDDIADVGCEIANITLGNAKPALNELGYQLDMTAPSLVRGTPHEIVSLANMQSAHIIVTTPLGNLDMFVALESNED